MQDKKKYIKLIVALLLLLTGCNFLNKLQAKEYLNDPSPSIRAQGIDLLIKLDMDEETKKVCKMLGDTSPRVRRQAAYALGLWNDSNCLDELYYSLNDKDITVLLETIHALGKIKKDKTQFENKLLPLLFHSDQKIRTATFKELESAGFSRAEQIKKLSSIKRDNYINRLEKNYNFNIIESVAEELYVCADEKTIASLEKTSIKFSKLKKLYGYALGLALGEKYYPEIEKLLNDKTINKQILQGIGQNYVLSQKDKLAGFICPFIKNSETNLDAAFIIGKYNLECNWNSIADIYEKSTDNEKIIISRSIIASVINGNKSMPKNLINKFSADFITWADGFDILNLSYIADKNLALSIADRIEKEIQKFLFYNSSWITKEKLTELNLINNDKILLPDLKKSQADWTKQLTTKFKNENNENKLQDLLNAFPQREDKISLFKQIYSNDDIINYIMSYTKLRLNLDANTRQNIEKSLHDLWNNEISYRNSIDILMAVAYAMPDNDLNITEPFVEASQIEGKIKRCLFTAQDFINLKAKLNSDNEVIRTSSIKAIDCFINQKQLLNEQEYNSIKQYIIGSLINILGKYGDGEAGLYLAKLDSNKAFPYLKAVLNRSYLARDKEINLITKIIQAMGYIKNQNSIDIISSYLTHPQLNIRLEAINSLYKMNNKKAYNYIMDFRYDYNSLIRQKVIYLNEISDR